MPAADKFRQIGFELKAHAPFTLFGALMGIAFMLAFKNMAGFGNTTLFRVFHPLHVVLSAMVTASMFKLNRNTKNFLLVLAVGWVGALGVATLSDSIIPYMGETVLGAAVPRHSDLHAHESEHDAQMHTGDDHTAQEIGTDEHTEHAQADAAAPGHEQVDTHTSELADTDHDHAPASQETAAHDHHSGPGLHIGFIEDWYIVNPAAILGVMIAFWIPTTKMPHAAHVLISTWASSAHMLMNTQAQMTAILLIGMFIVLFLAVWLPCCISDIVFPLLFVKSKIPVCSTCHHHHSQSGECS